MTPFYTNATVMWDEREISMRESLVREIPLLLSHTWRKLNPAVHMERVETPILTPASHLQSHIDAKFELIDTGKRGYLRPETTAGTYEAARLMYRNVPQLLKRLPFCLWQVGLSFRDEAKPDTMRASKLRLVQFYQMEFQLFAPNTTGAPYIHAALAALIGRYGGRMVTAADLPHYSDSTIDWYMGELEVAGCSIRNDWPHGRVYEVAIGIDRLVACLSNRAEIQEQEASE
ncbi:MAG: hypothetical protein KGI52_15565 [Burkholderiales bacterium]|nr:hypothetical protein [Burkholderiales bacterium]